MKWFFSSIVNEGLLTFDSSYSVPFFNHVILFSSGMSKGDVIAALSYLSKTRKTILCISDEDPLSGNSLKKCDNHLKTLYF